MVTEATRSVLRLTHFFAIAVNMNLIGDLAALRIPLPQPGDVTPEELYPDALEEAEQAREDYAFALEAQWDELQEDPLLIALGNARAAREAADHEIRRLLAYGREFHGDRPTSSILSPKPAG